MFNDTRRVAKKPSRRQLAQIDQQVYAVYRRVGNGVQINILDIGTILDAGREAALCGQDVEAALTAKLAQLRQN